MKNRPMLHITFRLERPIYFKLLREVKASKQSRSKFLRGVVLNAINQMEDENTDNQATGKN